LAGRRRRPNIGREWGAILCRNFAENHALPRRKVVGGGAN
jgi:hypothetical protein